MEQKPSIGRIVIYNHPGSADGKFAPARSPGLIRRVCAGNPGDETMEVDMVVFSEYGMMWQKNIPFRKEGDVPASNWEWPTRIV